MKIKNTLLTNRKVVSNVMAYIKKRCVGIGNPCYNCRRSAATPFIVAFFMVGRIGATIVAPFLQAVFPILFVQPPVRLETLAVGDLKSTVGEK